jgi:hypothetical protein
MTWGALTHLTSGLPVRERNEVVLLRCPRECLGFRVLWLV